jgi:hypothetical protein
LILSVAKDLSLIALATCDYDSTMGVGVLDDSPILKPQDLAGKKVASVPTSGEFPFFPAYAERVGLAAASIEFVHVDNKVLDRVLMEKRVDAITSFALGSASAMLSKGVPSRWMLYSAAGIRNHGQPIATRRKSRSGVVRVDYRRLARTARLYLDQSAELAGAVSQGALGLACGSTASIARKRTSTGWDGQTRPPTRRRPTSSCVT